MLGKLFLIRYLSWCHAKYWPSFSLVLFILQMNFGTFYQLFFSVLIVAINAVSLFKIEDAETLCKFDKEIFNCCQELDLV